MPEYTEEFEINRTDVNRPHVVLLGAGASRAAFPKGDANGRELPLMKDFVDVVGLEKILNKAGISGPYGDFEKVYSEIATDSSRQDVKKQLENTIWDYFSKLELPDELTLYDHLVLSLRRKDVIATFNWDPLLWKTCQRHHRNVEIPIICFLHGCVATGKCVQCNRVIAINRPCSQCGNIPEKIPILFPVARKNYDSDPAIASHWRVIREGLKHAWILTIFGYSAPHADVGAMEMLREGWGESADRELEDVEFIDIQNEDALLSSWDAVIHTHHYQVVNSFYDSYIAQHPRRSCEALFSQNMECAFISPFSIPADLNRNELYDWLRPRVDAEKKSG